MQSQDSIQTLPVVSRSMSQSISKLCEALSKAQGKFPVIPKDTKVDVYSKPPDKRLLYTYYYADLTTIIDATRPSLSENGISFTQYSKGKLFVTLLMHESGEYMETGHIPCVIPDGSDMKIVAGIVTYIKRISLTAALGISADDDVDAGPNEAHQGNSTNQTQNKKNTSPSGPQKSPPGKPGGNPQQQNKNQPKQSSQGKEPIQNHAPGGLSQKQIQRLYAIGLSKGWSSEYLRLKIYSSVKKTPGELDFKQYETMCSNFETFPFNAKAKAELDHMAQNLDPSLLEKITGKKNQEPPHDDSPIPQDEYADYGDAPEYENEKQ